MEQIRIKVEQKVPGLDIELSQLMEDLIGDLVAVPQPIEMQVCPATTAPPSTHRRKRSLRQSARSTAWSVCATGSTLPATR